MIFWSVVAALAGVAVAIGFSACFSRTERTKSGTYTPQALSVIGSALLSSFILVTAFLIAGSWATYNADRQHVYEEARSTTVAYWLAGKLPAADSAEVRRGLTDYVNTVIHEEWPQLAKKEMNNKAWADFDGLRAHVAAIRPADATAEKRRADVSAALDDLYQKRSVRMADIKYDMPSLLYGALVLAAILLIAYPPLVGMSGNRRNVTLLSGFAAMIGFGIYIVYDLSHPFSSPVSVPSQAFQLALERFAQIASGAVG